MGRPAKLLWRGVNQGDLVKLLVALVDCVTTQPVLAVNAGGQATFKTTVVPAGGIIYRINGQPLAKANLSAQVLTGFGLVNTGVGQFCLLRVELNATGVVGILQGGMVATAAEAAQTAPTRSADKATIGTILLPPSFIIGTTALDAAGVVFTDGDPDLNALSQGLS